MGKSQQQKRSPALGRSSSSGALWLLCAVTAVAVAAFGSSWASRSPEAQPSPSRRVPSTDNTPLSELLSDEVHANDPLYRSLPLQAGMHVLQRTSAPGAPKLEYTVYRHATNQTLARRGVAPDMGPVRVSFSAGSMAQFRRQLAQAARFNIGPAVRSGLKQEWALFTPSGASLSGASIAEIEQHALLVAMEGGKWIWPGVRVGFKRRVAMEGSIEGGSVALETLAMRPLVFRVSPFLSPEEIEHIIGQSAPHMRDSPVALMDHDQGKPASEWRTSTQHWLHGGLVDPIQRRAAALLKVPRDHQEGSVQVLRYKQGQKYDAHNDYFDMAHYKNQPEMMRSYDQGHKNRLLTLFWYMSDVPSGGETQFPLAHGRRFNGDFVKCQGLKVRPKKGSAVLFYSLSPAGELDNFSLHGGCPVLSENHTKWAANQWVWNKPF